jgi:hypothetical protein
MASEALVNPYYVQFHSTAEDEEGTGLAFPFLVVHENEDEHLDGWVFAHDARNTAGLTEGVNWRENIGKGGPGMDASWSLIEGQE